MAITLKSVWGHTERPWGYEVRVNFEEAGVIYNEVATFPQEPTQAVLDARVESLRVRLEEQVHPPPLPVEYSITNADGTVTEI